MSALLGPDGRDIKAPAILPRAPVVWKDQYEGIARAFDPITGAEIGPFRILIENHTRHVPPEHRLPYEPR